MAFGRLGKEQHFVDGRLGQQINVAAWRSISSDAGSLTTHLDHK